MFPDQDKVFAEWFTGNIRIPQGEMLGYKHSGYESIYERDLYLDLVSGKVVNSWLVENTPTEDEDNVCVFELEDN